MLGRNGGKPVVAIVGAGRVGTALGILLARRGYRIGGVVCRSAARAEEAAALIGDGTPHTDPRRGVQGAGLVLVAVPDAALPGVARSVAAARPWNEGDLLVHTSGAASAAVLRAPGAERALCLSIHPIQTVADPVSGAERLQGAAFGIEGDETALEAGEAIVREIGGRPLRIKPGTKALYHAAACVVANYAVALADIGLKLYEMAGIDRREGLAALLPLLAGAVANLEAVGVPKALTGPIERGDVQTVRAHLEALQSAPGEESGRIAALYRLLGIHTLGLVEEKTGGLTPAHRRLRELLLGAERDERDDRQDVFGDLRRDDAGDRQGVAGDGPARADDG